MPSLRFQFFFKPVPAIFLLHFHLAFINAQPCNNVTLTTQEMVNAFPSMNCDTITGNLSIRGNDITSLDSLILLKAITGSIRIDSTSIFDLDGLSSIIYSNEFIVENNMFLQDVDVLNNIDTIVNLVISGCDQLTSINIESILHTQTISVQNNSSLISLIANPSSLNGGLHLTISNNSLLETITGFDSIIYMFGISLNGNSSLTNISAFNNLRVVNQLLIVNNNALTTISCFPSLIIIGGESMISQNENLAKITLSSVRRLNQFYVTENPQLDHCCFAANFILQNVPGELFIWGNGSQCQNISQALQFCILNDEDEDSVIDTLDNCPHDVNSTQYDFDNDSIGNSCDNCPTVFNPDQSDENGNHIGDVCEIIGSSNVGINTMLPVSSLHIANGDLYIEEPLRGIILKNAEGNCFRIYFDLVGSIQSVQIQCPH